MKIPLAVSSIGRITTVVSIQAAHCFGFVTFVIDTGSPYTFLSEKDAARLKVPLKELKPEKKLIGLGGKPFEILSFRQGRFNFKAEEGMFTVNWPICLRSYAERQKYIYSPEELPSILGTDFMKENKFLLFYDPSKSVAYFEKEENKTIKE
jgi:hypothetical protein